MLAKNPYNLGVISESICFDFMFCWLVLQDHSWFDLGLELGLTVCFLRLIDWLICCLHFPAANFFHSASAAVCFLNATQCQLWCSMMTQFMRSCSIVQHKCYHKKSTSSICVSLCMCIWWPMADTVEWYRTQYSPLSNVHCRLDRYQSISLIMPLIASQAYRQT